MVYLALNLLRLNIEDGILLNNDKIETESLLNYLLKSTTNLIAIDKKIKEKNIYLKSIQNINFEYNNKDYILPAGIILDLSYIEYFEFNLKNFMELQITKIQENNNEIEIEEEIIEENNKYINFSIEELREECKKRNEINNDCKFSYNSKKNVLINKLLTYDNIKQSISI